MKTIRNRARERLPSVLLTLLSIVQALALEFLWSHIRNTDYLFDWSRIAVLSWLQISASFIGIVLIWLAYASTAMRFRWVPATSDSVYPFIIGLLEFTLIESLGPETIGRWLISMGIIFGLMTWVSQSTMRRARLDGENDEFFSKLAPATLRDFYPPIGIVGGFTLAGIQLEIGGDQATLAMIAVALTNLLLIWQLAMAARFWDRSVIDDAEQRSGW